MSWIKNHDKWQIFLRNERKILERGKHECMRSFLRAAVKYNGN